ncbi:838_t:CDS:1, partial [Gigaspora rosea]
NLRTMPNSFRTFGQGELFSKPSVEDNLLSNSDHLHELFSKSEVIDVSLMNTCKCRYIVVIVFVPVLIPDGESQVIHYSVIDK